MEIYQNSNHIEEILLTDYIAVILRIESFLFAASPLKLFFLFLFFSPLKLEQNVRKIKFLEFFSFSDIRYLTLNEMVREKTRFLIISVFKIMVDLVTRRVF